MRILFFIIAFLIPVTAFCAKNFFGEPSADEIRDASLFVILSSAICLATDRLYYKQKSVFILVFNIILHLAFGLVCLIAFFYSPLVSFMAFIMSILGFLWSFAKNH